MPSFSLKRLLDFFTGLNPVMGVLWLGLAGLTVGMLILMHTRWGQSRPLQKCIALSLFAHLLFGIYATTVKIVGALPPLQESSVDVTFLEIGEKNPAAAAETAAAPPAEKPWDQFRADKITEPDLQKPDPLPEDSLPEPRRLVRMETKKLLDDTPFDRTDPAEIKPPEPNWAEINPTIGMRQTEEGTQPIEAPKAQRREGPDPLMPAEVIVPFLQGKNWDGPLKPPPADTAPEALRSPGEGIAPALLQPVVPPPRLDAPATPEPADFLQGRISERDRPGSLTPGESPGANKTEPFPGDYLLNHSLVPPATDLRSAVSGSAGEASPTLLSAAIGPPRVARVEPTLPLDNSPSPGSLPEAYKLRMLPNRFSAAKRHGATAQTEKAVAAALKWLAENQADDGRWDAGDHEAGVERQILGRDRQNAGSQADSAVTGLALLAFLAAGNTHQSGNYRENVRRGLDYLLRAQAPDGNLNGKATVYERMYAHAMAACALSEAYGMTRDRRLQEPVRRAIGYILRTQDPQGGGWRYLPNIPGDTSQLGWQVMALKSAELAGIVMPDATRQGIFHFLQSVSAGRYGGLASYRPGEQVTRAMSAEALVCWQFLGLPREHPACNETGNYLLGELPRQDAVNPNDYYWYYATLAMFQLQGEYWRRWNDAMRETIVERQVKEGRNAGSWNTDTLWGGYGGRVYTTAIAALTLEVYYRYLPLYAETVPADQRAH